MQLEQVTEPVVEVILMRGHPQVVMAVVVSVLLKLVSNHYLHRVFEKRESKLYHPMIYLISKINTAHHVVHTDTSLSLPYIST